LKRRIRKWRRRRGRGGRDDGGLGTRLLIFQ
jgi:hypothetical protein